MFHIYAVETIIQAIAVANFYWWYFYLNCLFVARANRNKLFLSLDEGLLKKSQPVEGLLN